MCSAVGSLDAFSAACKTSAWLVREGDGGYRCFSGEGQWSTQSLFDTSWIIASAVIGLLVAVISAFCIHDAISIKLSAIPWAASGPPPPFNEQFSIHLRGVRRQF